MSAGGEGGGGVRGVVLIRVDKTNIRYVCMGRRC